MEFNQKEKIYLSPDKVRELLKELKPGTMLTLEMPESDDGNEKTADPTVS